MPLRILSSADFSGLLIAPACTTSNASIRLPHGTAPSGPADGDMWTTSTGLFVRINGVTVGPLGTGGGGGSGTVTSITAGTGLSGGIITTSGTIAIDQAAQIVSTKANDTATGGGQLYLNGATGNRIDFNANGAGAPTVTTRSVGTKLVLNPSVSASAVDTAIGFSSDIGVPSLWFSIPSSSTSGAFRWYTGATERIRVDQAGQIRFTAGTVSAPVISAGLSSSDTNTGIYFPAEDTIGFVEGGVEAMRIDSNGRINVLAGTAALPAISAGLNSSDTNTGIYFPAADSISIATAGVERMNINSSGVPTFTYADNTFQGVNIRNTSNTSNALNGLTIYDAANSAMGQINYVNAIYANSSLQDTFLINSVGDRKLGFIANNTGSAGGNSDIFFQAGSTTAGRIIYISGIDGVISVGMGASEASNTRMQIRGIGATSSTATLRVENSAGTEALTVMDDGQIRVRAGTAGVPSISAGLNSSDTNTGIYFPGTDQMALTTGGNGRLFVSNTGVGIGLNPSMAFHCDVAGSVLIRSSNADVGINVTQALAYTHIGSDPARQSPLYLRIDAEQVSCDPPTWQTTDFNDIYGNGGINSIILGEPDYWMEIRLGHATHSGKGGSIVLIPCYIPSNAC